MYDVKRGISEDAVAQRACLFADKVARGLPHVTDSRVSRLIVLYYYGLIDVPGIIARRSC